MKFNMVCIKFDQKIKKNLKNLNFGLFRFLRFFLKNLKNLGFFGAIFQPCQKRGVVGSVLGRRRGPEMAIMYARQSSLRARYRSLIFYVYGTDPLCTQQFP